MPSIRPLCLASAIVFGVSSPLFAGSPETVTITSSKDNTLIQTASGNVSLGAAEQMYAGRVGPMGGGTRRRGVLAFDVASAVPAGATITEVSLTLYMSQTIVGPQEVSLRRMLADWGEGTSDGFGGQGAPATPNDATWSHRFWPGTTWTTAGGDFSDVVSASKIVDTVNWYTWESTPQLVADVQDWLDNPSTSYGWLVQGNESVVHTVKQFATHEAFEDIQPALQITYVLTPQNPADLDDDGSVGVPDLLILLASWGECVDPGDCPADLTGDGSVGVPDLLDLLANWG